MSRIYCRVQKIKAKISLSNIRDNAQAFKRLSKTPVCAVVKANAYGHGAEEVVCALQSVVDCFAVALLDEAIAIRASACGKDILVLTPPNSEGEAYEMAANAFTASVTDLHAARLIVKVCEKFSLPIKVHLKVNTGMNRYGMNAQTLGKTCKLLASCRWVKVEGLYSHLYGATRESAYLQRERFLKMQAVCKRYFPQVISHLGATFGALLGQNFRFDMLRIGLGLYGYLPDCEGAEALRGRLQLKKAMAVYAPVLSCKKATRGGLGYGERYPDAEIEKLGKVSVCRFGYADGFLRRGDNGTDGAEYNAQNLCMDVCVRKQTYRRGEEIPVLTDADKTAREAGTIAYEVLCAATRRAEFVYEDG